MKDAKRTRAEAIYYGDWLWMIDDNPVLEFIADQINQDASADQETAEKFARIVARYYKSETGCPDGYAAGVAYQAAKAAGHDLEDWRAAEDTDWA